MDVDNDLKKYLTQRFFHGDSSKIKDDESLFEQGIIDSLGVLQLVSFLEEHFGVHIDDEENKTPGSKFWKRGPRSSTPRVSTIPGSRRYWTRRAYPRDRSIFILKARRISASS